MKSTCELLSVAVQVPVGYRLLCYRVPNAGDKYIEHSNDGRGVLSVVDCYSPSAYTSRRYIVEPIVTYRTPVMPDDYNKPIEVKDEDDNETKWQPATLKGYRAGEAYPCITTTTEWAYARIKV